MLNHLAFIFLQFSHANKGYGKLNGSEENLVNYIFLGMLVFAVGGAFIGSVINKRKKKNKITNRK